MISFERSLFFIARFFEGSRKVGLINAAKIFYLSKFYNGLLKIKIKEYNKPLYIRGKSSDADIFRIIFIHDEYPFLNNLNPKTILDAGANAGYAAVKFNLSYPSATIYSIEPEESNFNLLKKNVAGIEKIKLYNKALWGSSEKDLNINKGKSNVSFSMSKGVGKEDNQIEGITIEDILKTAGINEIDILKLDIEGAEKNIFEHSTKDWISKVKVIFVELHDNKIKGCGNAFFKNVVDKGFLFFVRGENIILIKEDLKITI